MKLTSHRVERGASKTQVHAKWRDRMRRSANVKIELRRGDQVVEDETLLVEGDIAELSGLMFGLAEIAWSMGWRPRGLMGTVARVVEVYQIPPESK